MGLALVRRMIQTTLEQDQALRRLSRSTGDSVASLIRRAIAEFLARADLGSGGSV